MTTSMTSSDLDKLFLDIAESIEGSGAADYGAVTQERVFKNFDLYGKALDFFMYYPDVFLDVINPVDSYFNLYPFQRVSLRAKMRKRQVFETATRGASKSWLAFASRYLTCMFVPRHNSFVATDVKEQAVSIAREKIQDDLWIKYPLLANEMRPYALPGGKPRPAVNSGKGYASYRFTSGSVFDVVGVDSARGKRRHSGIIEEAIEQDQTKINEKIIPLMNIYRRTSKGVLNPKEPFNAQKLFVTSAGYMGTFAYDKMIETLIMMILIPEEYMFLILDYRIPLSHDLISEKTIRETKSSPSFDPDSFKREYGSSWSGEMKGAVISHSAVQKSRVIKRPDYKPRNDLTNENGEGFYAIGADMAKDGSANTAVSVIRVSPGPTYFRYALINGFTIDSTDYEVVSNKLKEVTMEYNARLLIIDTNGIGAAIRDWINKPSFDPETGVAYPGFGIINPPKQSEKDVLRHREWNVVFEIKANGQSASDINWFFFSRVKSGSFKMLVTNRDAMETFGSREKWLALPMEKKQKSLRPYQYCDMLQRELLNLDVQEGGTNQGSLRVKRRDTSIEKDLFSATSYAMYGVHMQIEMPTYQKALKKTESLMKFIMVS